MAKGAKSTVPATPMKSSGARSEAMARSDPTFTTPPSNRMTSVNERSNDLYEPIGYSDVKIKEEVEDDYLEEKAAMPDLSEAATVSAGRSGPVRPIARNLAEELDDIARYELAHDSDYDETGGKKPSAKAGKTASRPSGTRPPLNGDTPAVSKVLRPMHRTHEHEEQLDEALPPPTHSSGDLDGSRRRIGHACRDNDPRQTAEETVQLLHAMGCEPRNYPSDVILQADASMALRKWKTKLRSAFGASELPPPVKQVDPSKVPLPQTPQKRPTEPSTAAVFSASGAASPYFQDSHMVTPKAMNSADHPVSKTEAGMDPTAIPTTQGSRRTNSRRCEYREDSSDSDDDLRDDDGAGDADGDLTSERARQIRDLSAMSSESTAPRLETATHFPLGNIKPYQGMRSKSEKSMQWLRAFVYEMKGTHTPPNVWCMAFELSLQDGALHWYRQLPRKTRRTWKLLSDAFIKYYCSRFGQSAKARYYSAKREDKEHVCDYLNRLNGYARNAGVQFENGGRESKDHVAHFLDTCDDRGLEELLCHVRVRNIHDLEDMINDILRRRERKTKRDLPMRRPRGPDESRRRDSGRNDDPRDGYRRDRRDRDDSRRRDESQYRPRVTLADALSDIVSARDVNSSTGLRSSRSTTRSQAYEESDDYEVDERSYNDGHHADEYSDNGYGSDEDHGYVDAANDTERRDAAEGSFARGDNRRLRGGPNSPTHDRDDRRFNRDGRDGREGRRQFGPCAACGGLNHSAHYCFKRCMMCKQVHDAGKCEVFQELTTLLRSKVDKKELTPELQELIFGSHLN